jgi:hypothetical protein
LALFGLGLLGEDGLLLGFFDEMRLTAEAADLAIDMVMGLEAIAEAAESNNPILVKAILAEWSLAVTLGVTLGRACCNEVDNCKRPLGMPG